MDRDIPAFNRPIMDRINAKNHQLHLKRLKNIKSNISSNKSYQKPSYSNLNNSNSITGIQAIRKLPQYNNVKKEITEQHKKAEIQRQNALLFNKMIKIMKRPDKNNDPSITMRQFPTSNAAKQRLSMEYTKINEENRTFYDRLQKQKPTIDNKKLEQERLKNLNILKFLGKYPNEQVASRTSHQHSFDMRTRKMNSTSNQIRYHNRSYRDEQEILITQERDKYQKFRNQINIFDNQFRQLRQQHQNPNKNAQKYMATASNFHRSSRQNNSVTTGYGNIVKISQKSNINMKNTNLNSLNTTKNDSIDQPELPNRRKFMSQGGNRRTYNQASKINPLSTYNIYGDSQYGRMIASNRNTHHESAQVQKPYPYHLNHPSTNIMIDDKNQHYRNKRSIQIKEEIPAYNEDFKINQEYGLNDFQKLQYYQKQQEKMARQINKSIKTNKNQLQQSKITTHSQQRKLNSKNSKSNLLEQRQKSIQAINQQQFKLQLKSKQRIIHQNYNDDSHTNHSKIQNLQGNHQKANNIGSQNKKNHRNVLLKSNKLQQNGQVNLINNYKPEKIKIITLYKTRVTLDKLLGEEQIYELCEQVYKQCVKNAQMEWLTVQVIRDNLSYYLAQHEYSISVNRTDNTYKICITRISTNKSHKTTHNAYDLNEKQQKQMQILRFTMRESVQHSFCGIKQIQLTEQQGSLLLEDIDYDYRLLIAQMLKVERVEDTQQQEQQMLRSVQKDANETQEKFVYSYKLVIMLRNDEQDHLNVQNAQNGPFISNPRTDQLQCADEQNDQQSSYQDDHNVYSDRQDKILQNENHHENSFAQRQSIPANINEEKSQIKRSQIKQVEAVHMQNEEMIPKRLQIEKKQENNQFLQVQKIHTPFNEQNMANPQVSLNLEQAPFQLRTNNLYEQALDEEVD